MSHGRFAKLIELAKLSDSARRRELLREVTDLFFETSATRTTRESALFDDVLQMVASDMQDEVLAELSNTFADAPDAPVGLMRDLANHSFEVAGPVLPRSGDVLHVTRAASVQFLRPIMFRVIRVLDWPTYDGWLWLDGYELNAAGDAVNRRSIFVLQEGLRQLQAAPAPRQHTVRTARRPVVRTPGRVG